RDTIRCSRYLISRRPNGILEDCLQRSLLTSLIAYLLLACSTPLVACKSESQPAETTTTAAAQPQPTATSAATPAQPVRPAGTNSSSAPQTVGKNTASAPAPSGPQTPAVSVAGLPDVDPREALGSKSAPIVIETFSDYQCPACKQLYMNSTRQLTDNYVATGKVYWIHRDFPLPMHAHSRVAARYGRAAAQIGKLEQVEEVLFQNQEKW